MGGPACPVCGAAGPRRPALTIQHVLYRCEACGLLYSERVGLKDLSRYYSEDDGEFFDRPYFDRADVVTRHPEFRNYEEALRRCRGGAAAPALLDAGCGTGALLQVAERLGYRAEGLEVSAAAARRISGAFAVHLFDGDFDRLPAMGPFDVIVLWDVLEHLAEPVRSLARLKPFLKPGGRLLIRTIDEDCLLARASLLMARAGFLAPARRMHELHHVVYFTRETLDACLRRAGFAVLDRWGGEYPVERASRNPVVRAGLRAAYALQFLAGRPFEQYAIARADG